MIQNFSNYFWIFNGGLEKKVSSLLVVNKFEEVCGIVTTDDLLWHLARLLSDESDQPKKAPLFNAINQQTVGEIANGIANAGI